MLECFWDAQHLPCRCLLLVMRLTVQRSLDLNETTSMLTMCCKRYINVRRRVRERGGTVQREHKGTRSRTGTVMAVQQRFQRSGRLVEKLQLYMRHEVDVGTFWVGGDTTSGAVGSDKPHGTGAGLSILTNPPKTLRREAYCGRSQKNFLMGWSAMEFFMRASEEDVFIDRSFLLSLPTLSCPRRSNGDGGWSSLLGPAAGNIERTNGCEGIGEACEMFEMLL